MAQFANNGWFRVPNAVVDRLKEIGLAAFAVYCVIAKHADQDGIAWPSVGTIAKTCGITDRTVRRSIKKLAEAGLIKKREQRDDHGRNQSNRYILSPVGEDDTRAPPGVLSCQGEGDTRDPGEGDTTTPRTRPNRNKTQENKTHPLPPTLDTPEFRDAWERWEKHRCEIRKSLTPSTRQQQLEQLAGFGVERAIKSIVQSITAGWTGLFEPKENGRNGRPKQLSIGPGQRHVGDGDNYGREGVF